jgi:hypothetical protein
MREVLWQHAHRILRRDSPESTLDLVAWIVRDRRLDHLDIDSPEDILKAERLRLDSIVDAITLNQGWVAGGTILNSRRGWPKAFVSRMLRPRHRTRAEITWVADMCGLRIVWVRQPGGWRVALALPGVSLPAEFDQFT